MELEQSVNVSNTYGLHARASTLLANLAGKFQSEVRISTMDCPEPVDAKSILEIMSMGAEKGQELRLWICGDDAERAMQAILDLFERKFDEE